MTLAQIQVRRILDYQVELAKRSFDERRDSIYAEHSAKGVLRSGTTIRRVVRLMEELGATLVSDSIEKVSVVARDSEAFSEVETVVADFWQHLETELLSTLNIASGRHPKDDQYDSISVSGENLFKKSRALVKSKMELYRFNFLRPEPPEALEPNVVESPSSLQKTQLAKKGGRPPAQFWDDMWAFIAGALYEGSLNPKNQADLERAMTDWIESNNSHAAVSTVRSRARRLWDRIAVLDD